MEERVWLHLLLLYVDDPKLGCCGFTSLCCLILVTYFSNILEESRLNFEAICENLAADGFSSSSAEQRFKLPLILFLFKKIFPLKHLVSKIFYELARAHLKFCGIFYIT